MCEAIVPGRFIHHNPDGGKDAARSERALPLVVRKAFGSPPDYWKAMCSRKRPAASSPATGEPPAARPRTSDTFRFSSNTSGKTMAIEVGPNDSIEMLKAKIQDHIYMKGIPLKDLRVVARPGRR